MRRRRRRNLYLRAFEPRFKFHFRVTAGRGGGYGVGYFFEMQFYDRPLRRAEDDNGYAPAGQVLLVAHVFIGGDKDIETSRLGRGEQVTIAESIPTAIFGFRQDGEANKAQEGFAEFVIPSSHSPVAFDFLEEVFYR